MKSIKTLAERIKTCDNIEELIELETVFRDIMLEIVNFLSRNGMKTKLRKTRKELLHEQFELLTGKYNAEFAEFAEKYEGKQ